MSPTWQTFVSADRKRREASELELELRNRELLSSRIALVKQDEAERRLLAADLHDQALSELRIILNGFQQYVDEPDADKQKAIVAGIKQVMTDIREVMDDLCPTLLGEFGFAAAVEDRLDKAYTHYGLEVSLSDSVEASVWQRYSLVETQLLYRLVQEAITNACKHSRGSKLNVQITIAEGFLLLKVVDNGQGCDFSNLSRSSRGTQYMRLRAALIGASVTWQRNPEGSGTIVQVMIPVRKSKDCEVN